MLLTYVGCSWEELKEENPGNRSVVVLPSVLSTACKLNHAGAIVRRNECAANRS
jgi:hypothetical protein